jgi:hypothetical protein
MHPHNPPLGGGRRVLQGRGELSGRQSVTGAASSFFAARRHASLGDHVHQIADIDGRSCQITFLDKPIEPSAILVVRMHDIRAGVEYSAQQSSVLRI